MKMAASLVVLSLIALPGAAPPPGGEPLQTPPTRQNPAQEDPAERMLTIEPKVIDFGTIHRGERFEREITITNTSDQAIMITRAFSTCGCTVPSIPEDPIAPGESVTVTLEYLASNPGPADIPVQFFVDRQLGAATMTVSADVLHPVTVEPASFDPLFPQDLTVILTSTDESEFTVYAAEPDVISGLDKTARVKHELTLDAEKAKALKRPFNSVRFYVDHKRASIVFLRSSAIEVTTETQRIMNWARGAGEVEALEELLEQGADINRPDANGRTPLMFAAQMGQAERVLILLEHGADVRMQRPDGENALMSAAKAIEGNETTMQILLDAGADVNSRDQFGRSALFWCARSGDPERLRLLLDSGADVNVRGPYDETELIAAVKSRNPDKVRLLLEAGADPTISDSQGRDALVHAKATRAYSGGAAAEPVEKIVRMLEEALASARR